MSKEFQDQFIRFGRGLDKEHRQIIMKYWQMKFKMHDKLIVADQPELAPYKSSIDQFLANPTICDVSSKSEKIYQDVTQRFFNKIEDLQKEVDLHSPFQEEESSLNNWKQTSLDDFFIRKDSLLNNLSKQYNQVEFNLEFFQSQFRQFSDEKGKNENLKALNEKRIALKQEILDRWQILLLRKKHQWFLEELDKIRKAICEEIYNQIDQYKKMQKILVPFTDECGRLWDLSKGLWYNVGFEILEQYANLLQKESDLQKLAEMLGRMHLAEDELEDELIKEIIIKPKIQIIHAGKSELVGIHDSNDLNNLIPVELSLLDDPVTELIFYNKFAEKKLLTYQFIGFDWGTTEEERTRYEKKPKKKERGPIIICVDTSGSMHGTPEYVAKVLCFAIVRIALVENRQCFLISFSTGIKTIELTDLNRNLPLLIEFLSFSFHGGTDAVPPLKEALKQLNSKNYEKADVLMISDFIMSSLPSEIATQIENAQKNQTRFHSLIISSAGNPQVLKIFDNNWVYTPGGHETFKPILKNLRTLNTKIPIKK